MTTEILWASADEATTEAAGERLATALPQGGVVLLEGEMGSGKTVLVRGLARALGVDPREVQSPSYGLIHEHQGEHGRLVHVDLYRLESGEEEALGLYELVTAGGVVAIEWAERLLDPRFGRPTVRVGIQRRGAGEREIRLEGPSLALLETGESC